MRPVIFRFQRRTSGRAPGAGRSRGVAPFLRHIEGCPPCFPFQSYNYAMTGGAISAGLANELRTAIASMLTGALGGGAFAEIRNCSFPSTAGALNGGISTETRKLYLSSSLGALGGGSFVKNIGYQYSTVGGSIDGGTFAYQWIPSNQTYYWTMQGGCIEGGISNEIRKLPILMSSGLIGGGISIWTKKK